MSVSTPSRRAVSRLLSSSSPFQYHQRRAATKGLFNRGSSAATSDEGRKRRSNPILDEYLRKNAPTAPSSEKQQALQMPRSGDLASSSIFEDGSYATSKEPETSDSPSVEIEGGLPGRKIANMSRIIDPDPGARERWERKKVIQMVRRGGRLNRTQMLKRTEREHLVKSHSIKTSVKKLGMLARQIAGKTLDDAIVQMRFSKKKAAVELRAQLEAARDEAIVMRGMGLGQVVNPDEAAEREDPAPKAEEPIDIQLKDGQRHTVTDRSKIYIDQAWVGRGAYGKMPEFRARGRVNMLRPPWTSISVVLKEEATRVRQWQDREEKRKRQRTGDKVWTALPDRPIQIQRQWYSW